jgi:anti-sigma factor RsiW
MMTCQQLAELLCDFISGELETAYCVEIQEHIHTCPACEAYVHSYRVTITMTRQLPTLPLNADFASRLENLLRQMKDAAE